MTNCQSYFPSRSVFTSSWVVSLRKRLMPSVVSCQPSRIKSLLMLRSRRLSMLFVNGRPVRLLLLCSLRTSSPQRLWLLSSCCHCQTWSLRVCLVVIHQLLVHRRAEVLGWFPRILLFVKSKPLHQVLDFLSVSLAIQDSFNIVLFFIILEVPFCFNLCVTECWFEQQDMEYSVYPCFSW